MERIFKQMVALHLISLVVLSPLCLDLLSNPQFVEKTYPETICSRKNSLEDFASALTLKARLEKNPLVCLALTLTLPKLSRKKRAVKSWKTPQNLPDGSQITYCSDLTKCCKPKKSLNGAGTHYSLCRECIHLVTLPASYTPRQHFHVTCQDEDYSETCFTGEGGCATNLVPRTINFNSKEVTIILGHSCSCEILQSSIFSDYI
ncbi:uncharacterized protein LOC101235340 isoform X2 [Hydra vulgaris]|uniref:uncharacterized protein LOC101235340 isoform X2 n=1 Tax=Hydra vulgaris TaxID=6087 RepID=UPI001F5F5782|nr:uncharacterized protein LOC101235340 isoform X2 [Hydra vulgaris]